MQNRSIYGTRRIAKILGQNEITISTKRIGELMALAGFHIKTKGKFKATTNSSQKNKKIIWRKKVAFKKNPTGKFW